MPWSNIFSAFLFHSNFRSHLGDGWDGQEIASPWCWREEALLPSAPLPASIDSYSSPNSWELQQTFMFKTMPCKLPTSLPLCFISQLQQFTKKLSHSGNSLLCIYAVLRWEEGLERNRKKGKTLERTGIVTVTTHFNISIPTSECLAGALESAESEAPRSIWLFFHRYI